MVNKRLASLKRQNAGRLLLPKLKEQLLRLVKFPEANLEFIPLVQSLTIVERAVAEFPSRVIVTDTSYPFAHAHFPTWPEMLFSSIQSPGYAFMEFPEFANAGLLRMPTRRVFEMVPHLITNGFNDLCVIDEAVKNKLVAQKLELEPNRSAVLDLAIWGSDWTEILQ